MANTRRNQEYLGIDTNVLVAYLDRDHPFHEQTRRLAQKAVALNPTIIHEAYHTLVFKMKWRQEDASQVLIEACRDENNLFIGQTLKITTVGLRLAVQHQLGGRDALILANFLTAQVSELITYDESLLALKKVRYGRATITIKRP